MITIGIDPGLAATGLAAIASNGQTYSCFLAMTIRTKPSPDTDARINEILEAIERQTATRLASYDTIVIEKPVTQFSPGARNLMGLIGTAVVAGACFGRFVDARMIPPTAWLRGKSIIQRHEEFRLVTGYREKCSDHARDAACIALAVALGRI